MPTYFGKNDVCVILVSCSGHPPVALINTLPNKESVRSIMKPTTTSILIMTAFVLAPTEGREAMLGDEDKGQRRLFFKNIDYEDIYGRCCDEAKAVDEWPDCNCPKRLSEDTSWLDALFNKDNAKTYKEKWEEQCSQDGWLFKKAFPN